jgi:lysophospholipase L1-like esterase
VARVNLSRLRHWPKRFWRTRRREIFALAATLLFFFGAEALVRVANVVGRPPADTPGVAGELEQSIIDDPQLFWRFKPNQDMEGDERIYRINALGLRDDEVALPKPAGQFRILSLGESTSFGAGVALEETYTKVAERILRARFPELNIRTVNAGVGAYTSFQCVEYLELEGAKLQPDMVWLFSAANDGLASFIRNYKNLKHGFGYTDRELFELRNRHAGLLSLLNRSDLYKLLRRLQTGHTLASYGQNVAGREGDLKQQAVWRPRVPEIDRLVNLKRFVELSTQLRAEPIFLLPCYWNSEPDAPLPMRRLAKNTDTPLVDLPRAVHASGHFSESWYSLRELGGHPNAVGHRIMGEAVADALTPWFAALK